MASQLEFDLRTPSGRDDDHQRLLPPTPRRLVVEESTASTAQQINRTLTLGTSLVARTASRVLANRGLSPLQNLDSFLHGSLSNLPNPSRLHGFDAAIDAILTTIQSGRRIGIVADYDVDGVTSASQFVRLFSAASADYRHWIPNRFRDGFGINHRIVDEILEQCCSLVILLDHGTHALSQVARLHEKGITTVIFDHHVAGSTLPQGILVNPRKPGSGFQEEYPCASGLSYLACARLSEHFNLPKPDCGLAVIGTIADMVPLRGLNRIIARIGLSDLRRTDNIGIKQLSYRLGLDVENIQSTDIGFQIGPAINAAGRMQDASVCIDLFTTNDPTRAAELSNMLYYNNEERKQEQRASLLDNYRRLGTRDAAPRVLVSYNEAHHQGLVGLVAQGLAQRYTRPAFVFAPADGGELRGSARSGHESYDLTKIMERAEHLDQAGIIIRWGGHQGAAGLSIKSENIRGFTSLIQRAFSELHSSSLDHVTIRADARLTLADITPSFAAALSKLIEPVGQGFAPPQFLLENLTVAWIAEYPGGRHLLALCQGTKKARAFIGPELWNRDISTGAVITIIATPATIYRNDKQHVQLSISGYTVLQEGDGSPPISKVASATQRSSSKAPQKQPPQIVETSRDERLPAWAIAATEAKLPKESRAAALGQQLKRVAQSRDDRFLYPDLDSLAGNPPSGQERQLLWKQLLDKYQLNFNTSDLEYRPAHIEFIRYFFDQPGNHFLQAPTGSGKTEIALMIASQFRQRGHRVIFVAPTISIVHQVAGRVERLLSEKPTVMDGSTTTPRKRSKLHTPGQLGCIVGTPHVLANDLKAGIFSITLNDLLIVDEAHHTTGRYPFVPLVEAARHVGSRVLMLTATPGQVTLGQSESGSEWGKLDELQKLVGVSHIFPLNMRLGSRAIRATRLEKDPSIEQWSARLADKMHSLRESLFSELTEIRASAILAEATRQLGHKAAQFRSWPQLRGLMALIQTLPKAERWKPASLVLAMSELYQIHDALVQQGICSFLLRCIEKRTLIHFPITARVFPSGAISFLPSSILQEVYNSHEVEDVFHRITRGAATGLWHKGALQEALGINYKEILTLDQRTRTKALNTLIRSLKERVVESLVPLDYYDHPRERYVLEQLQQHQRRTFISVREREHAIFLARRINARLGAEGIVAVPITGTGDGASLGLSHREREVHLRDFNEHRASVIVATSAGNEGIDLVADIGLAVVFDSSQTKSKQKEGRVGRRNFSIFEYLCYRPEDYGKYLIIQQKELRFQELLNDHRRRLLNSRGDTLKEPSEGTVVDDDAKA